jgi:hypothetical protein
MFVAESVILTSSQTRRIDVKLELGQATAEVTVIAAASVIEREEAKLAATVSEAE